MERKTSAHYQRLHRQRLRDKGLVKKELWVLPEFADELLAVEKQMRQPRWQQPPFKGESMHTNAPWSIDLLHQTLHASALVTQKKASLELLNGSDACLLITMHDFGDLSLFLAIAGGQIVLEVFLWPVSHVENKTAFNEQVLRMQKIFPVATVAIEAHEHGEPAYIVFSALSASVSLARLVYEIETLSHNVLQMTEVFEALLKTKVSQSLGDAGTSPSVSAGH